MEFHAVSADTIKGSCFFIFRKLPSEFHADFLTENAQAKDRLEALKNRIFSSSIEVYKGSVQFTPPHQLHVLYNEVFYNVMKCLIFVSNKSMYK